MTKKNLRITSLSLFTLAIILITWAIFPDINSKDFSVFEFAKGMLTGMCGVASIAWLISTYNEFRKDAFGKNIKNKMINNNQVLLGLGMTFLFIAITLNSFLTNNSVLILSGSLLLGISVVFNIVYLVRKGKTNFTEC